MTSSMKALVLGSGLVAKPGVQYLAENGFDVVVASRTLDKAVELCQQAKKDAKNDKLPVTAVQFDVENDDKLLTELVHHNDYIISLLPYTFHVKVAKEAIKQKKHFFTTSYVSDAMRQLQQEAQAAGVIVLNECGVDPGTDHMSAMRIINDVHHRGGKILSFTSYCGGLPSPDCNDNPFGYKLSWAPRGVLLASRNDATFLQDGKDVFIPGKVLFDNYKLFNIEGLGEFEGYPNRNSKQYIDIYGIPEVQTIVRGTFRNKGWCPTIKKIADLGYLSIEEQQDGLQQVSFAELTRKILGSTATGKELREACAKHLQLSADDKILDRIEWIGLLSEREMVPPKTKTKLDALCHLFKSKLVYKDGERDLLLMQHYFIAHFPSTGKKEHITSTMIDYGISHGDTSMSRTVSLPVAIAVKLVATGKLKGLTGLQVPMSKEFYDPILGELDKLGIKFVEKLVKVEQDQ
jgi:saccharopine dehydrogenase (NADP+, L-glutamate forming)/spermidine synthase